MNMKHSLKIGFSFGLTSTLVYPTDQNIKIGKSNRFLFLKNTKII